MVAPQYSGVARPLDAPKTASKTAHRTDPDTAELVTLDEIRDAAELLRGIAVRTPLLSFPAAGPTAWLKPENLQPVGAFKIRGAYVAIARLPEAVRARGVVTHSSGNHAQGIARAARLLGVTAIAVMPENAPPLKVERTIADGADVVFSGNAPDDRVGLAHRIAGERGMALISSYDDRDIIAGQATVGLEIAEDAPPGPLTVYVPVSGGGLASGVATALKALRQDVRIFGVEPELAADALESLREGAIVRWPADKTGRTMADGQRVQALGRLPFAHLRAYLDGIVTVSEAEILEAMRVLAVDARIVAEPSGAVAPAALLRERPADRTSVAVVSGGNVDPELYARVLSGMS
jgi:threonine dehydratase